MSYFGWPLTVVLVLAIFVLTLWQPSPEERRKEGRP